MKKILFYCKTGRGICLHPSTSEDDAYDEILAKVGTLDGVKEVREATEADIQYVKGMGGWVPKI